MTGYDIYRGGSFLKSVAATTASDTGLFGSTTYSYYVKAKDAACNQSVSSNTVSATTQSGGIAACSGALTSAAAIQAAMINASAGTIITIAPGTYSGIRAAIGDPRLDANGVPTGVFYSGASGTSGSRNGNSSVVDAFQNRTHGSSYPTGTNNDFKNNNVHLDGVGYIVNAVGGSAKVKDNTRSEGL